MPPDWRDADESLIRRGEPILELGFVENHQRDLDSMDRGKEDSTYKLTPYIHFLTAVRCLCGVPYRQLEGFTRAIHRLAPHLPSGDIDENCLKHIGAINEDGKGTMTTM